VGSGPWKGGAGEDVSGERKIKDLVEGGGVALQGAWGGGGGFGHSRVGCGVWWRGGGGGRGGVPLDCVHSKRKTTIAHLLGGRLGKAGREIITKNGGQQGNGEKPHGEEKRRAKSALVMAGVRPGRGDHKESWEGEKRR